MSKFLKSMIVLLAIVAMATPVMAEDMLSLGGQMRVRGWHIDNGTQTSSATGIESDATKSWADQRLRIGGKLSIADGVSITFRTDITESNWGTGNVYGSGRLGMQQWDRAHIDLDFSSFSIRAGQQYIALGKAYAFDAQTNGLQFKTKGAVAVTAFFMLQDSNQTPAKAAGYKINATGTGTTPILLTDATDKSDGFYYGANLAFGADAFKGNAYFAASNGVTGTKISKVTYKAVATGSVDQDIYLAGADVTLNLDAFKLVAALDYFTGDATATKDAFGTQLFVDASLAAGEAMTFGGQLFYALGSDDPNDVQYANLGNGFGGWDPLDAIGTGLDNEQIGTGRPAVYFGDNSGVVGGRLYTSIKAGDSLTLGASVAYLVPEEDAIVTADSSLNVAAGLKYAVLANTSIGVQVEFIDDDDKDVDSAFAGGVGLFVNF